MHPALKPSSLKILYYSYISPVLVEARNELEKEFVKENPNSIVSAFRLSVFSRDWGQDFTKEHYNKFSQEIKLSVYGQRISNYIVHNKNIEIGSNYAAFEIRDLHGDTKKLSDALGKVTLLEFWASWYGPCGEENPNLVKTYEKYQPEGFEIFAVSLDKDKEKWLSALKKDNLRWPNFCDFEVWENEAALMYAVYMIPDNFLIDKNEKMLRGIFEART